MWNCESRTTCTPELYRLAVFKIMKNFDETCITESKEELFLRALQLFAKMPLFLLSILQLATRSRYF